MEGTMGDEEHDKSIIEKTIETVKDIATKASDAAKKALEPEPPKPGEEVVFLPAAGDGFADPLMPSALMMPVVVKTRAAKRKVPAKKAAAKKAAKKSSKKSVTKRKAAKAWKPAAGRKAFAKNKTTKNSAKKKKAKR